MNSILFNKIFQQAINDYHISDNIDYQYVNPFVTSSLEYLLYKKCWIDTVQWHLEDIIRATAINPEMALKLKRRIDLSNQDRTDLVEQLDEYFFVKFEDITVRSTAKLNTETPAWSIDRLSILNLKIFHMSEEANRTDATEAHKQKCSLKLNVLNQQFKDLSLAIDQLFEDILNGNRISKTYKQMKMYNDPELNPILRNTTD